MSAQLLETRQAWHDDSQNSREAAWFHMIACKVTVNPAIKDEICTVKLEMAEWRKQWFSEQWMSTNALLHLLVPWSSAMLWWMTRKRNMFLIIKKGQAFVKLNGTEDHWDQWTFVLFILKTEWLFVAWMRIFAAHCSTTTRWWWQSAIWLKETFTVKRFGRKKLS